MNKEYDVIVVGGGMAGLTSMAYLCRAGVRTLLVEKGEKPGGLVSTFWYQGFAFDAGIRAFENSGILFPMLKSLGIEIEFVRNPVSIGIQNQWVKLGSRDSLRDYAAMLINIFPDNAADIFRIAEEIRNVMSYMDVLYGIDNPLVLEDMQNWKYLTNTLLPWLMKYKKNIRKAEKLSEPVYVYLKHLTKNEALIDLIAQHFFKSTPAFFALSYFGLYLDYCYPVGGTGTLAQKMAEYINRTEGEILTNTAANQVDPLRHEVLLSDGQTLRYSKLVWAADQKTLYSIIKGVHATKVIKQHLLVEKSTGGDSILTLFMGVDLAKDYFDDHCGAHTFYTPVTEGLSVLPHWKEAAEIGKDGLLEWVGSYLERTTYEISCPALRDVSLAPEGKAGVIVSTLMDYSIVRVFSDLGEYESFKQYCTKKITNILKMSLFPEIQEKTLFALCATPLTIERETGNTQGAITGWAFTNTLMPAENHFPKIRKSIKTPIGDIVQCGQWTFSPSGLPVSVLTGKLAANEVRKALKS